MTEQALSEGELARFRRDGFVVVRALFGSEEIVEIRETFMAMNRDGPVEGLSEIRRKKVDGEVGGYDSGDPLAFYPRMMHPHRHADKPVGPVAMRYMIASAAAPDPRCAASARSRSPCRACSTSSRRARAGRPCTRTTSICG